jgi:hypothetical protein
MSLRPAERLEIPIRDPAPAPHINAIRISLHPRGLAPRIANLAKWRAHLLHGRPLRFASLTVDQWTRSLS